MSIYQSHITRLPLRNTTHNSSLAVLSCWALHSAAKKPLAYPGFHVTGVQGRKRNVFQRGQSHSSFFPGVKCFFPVENSHFGRPKTNFSGFEKWKAKKKKKKEKKKGSSPHFVTFLPLGRSAEIPGQKSPAGALCPLPPCLLHHCRGATWCN